MTKKILKIFKSVITGIIVGAFLSTLALFLFVIAKNWVLSEKFLTIFRFEQFEVFRIFIVVAIIGGIGGGIGKYLYDFD